MKIRPFAQEPTFTMFANVILDEVFPTLSYPEWSALTFIIRKTKGYHREEDFIAYSQFIDGSNIKSINTLKDALRGLAERGIISLRYQSNKSIPTQVRLNPDFEIDDGGPISGNDTGPISGNDIDEEGPISGNDTTKEKEIRSPTLPFLEIASEKKEPPIEWDILLEKWAKYFPEKPQPRATNRTLRKKLATRTRDSEFVDGWERALSRASKSSFLHSSGFFTLDWFLKNDDHWTRCLNGNYDDNGTASSRPRANQPANFGIGARLEEYQNGATAF